MWTATATSQNPDRGVRLRGRGAPTRAGAPCQWDTERACSRPRAYTYTPARYKGQELAERASPDHWGSLDSDNWLGLRRSVEAARAGAGGGGRVRGCRGSGVLRLWEHRLKSPGAEEGQGMAVVIPVAGQPQCPPGVQSLHASHTKTNTAPPPRAPPGSSKRGSVHGMF